MSGIEFGVIDDQIRSRFSDAAENADKGPGLPVAVTEPRRPRKKIADCKTPLGYWFWNAVNRAVVPFQFPELRIENRERLPEGPFILVANHSSRWDGLLMQYLLDCKACYMVSPNEIRGAQRPAVLSVGAFPADPRMDIIGHCISRLRKGEPVVIFPEGNVFYDGKLHRFKTGAARLAIETVKAGLGTIPLLPVAIRYEPDNGQAATIEIGDCLVPSKAFGTGQTSEKDEISDLTVRLHESIAALLDKYSLENSSSVQTCQVSFSRRERAALQLPL